MKDELCTNPTAPALWKPTFADRRRKKIVFVITKIRFLINGSKIYYCHFIVNDIRENFTIGCIIKVSIENRHADKILAQKVIRTLLHIEGLVIQELPFVFKGGTALMLHLKSSKRLSIDIDIIMPVKHDKLDEFLDLTATEKGFLRKELQKRNSNSNLDKAHYKFFYNPLHKTSKDEEYVLLDILFEEVQYKNLVDLNIESVFLPKKKGNSFNRKDCLYRRLSRR